jgi:hypothetical protein
MWPKNRIYGEGRRLGGFFDFWPAKGSAVYRPRDPCFLPEQI